MHLLVPITGDLTVKEVIQPVTLDLEGILPGSDPINRGPPRTLAVQKRNSRDASPFIAPQCV